MQGPAAFRYRKLLHHLAVDLCVSPPRRMRHGGAFTRLHFSIPHFPSQHVANPAHARCTQLPSIARARSHIYRGDRCHVLNSKHTCGVFTSEYSHSYRQTNGKYTGKESTQEAVCWSCRGWRMQNNRQTLGTQASHLSETWTDWAHSDMTDVDWLV